ncbi:hypothetical protein GCM10012286_44860 [Streptomyces lasiicapitis]|uniref:Uncharacterized protein n=1 Tax=Streptomyces lasiicapitis TaxID=1923961 RepID=A0ABQ2M9H2_9ACTN|nr:hypothetical protein GCM10012286_44860 [Streptomyces lasiicapitis]
MPAVAAIDGRYDHGDSVDDDSQVADESRLQNGVELCAVEASLLAQAAMAGAVRLREHGGELIVVHVGSFAGVGRRVWAVREWAVKDGRTGVGHMVRRRCP